MNQNCILPTSYWPNIQYFTKIISFSNIFIETDETYPKQTYRNRCELYTANGKNSIQVPVVKGSFSHIVLCDLQLSYDTNWQKNHLKTIESAYRATPFFEYYFDDVLDIYAKKYDTLLHLNKDILNTCLQWLDLNKKITYTESFVAKFNGNDFRTFFNPKINKQTNDPGFEASPYIQGFEQRHGFIPNLSILDLIFNTGSEAIQLIKNSIA